jgi:hypothetical protein
MTPDRLPGHRETVRVFFLVLRSEGFEMTTISVSMRVHGSNAERVAKRVGAAFAEALGAVVQTAGEDTPAVSVESSKATVVEN